jgi:hypothetical protein
MAFSDVQEAPDSVMSFFVNSSTAFLRQRTSYHSMPRLSSARANSGIFRTKVI